MRLVLASSSPRRREILALLGLDHEVRPPDVEEILEPGAPAGREAQRLAVQKSESTAVEPGELVLAADTLVVLDDEILVKPADGADAVRMLMRLQGRPHTVYTGLALRRSRACGSARLLRLIARNTLPAANRWTRPERTEFRVSAPPSWSGSRASTST